MTYPTMAEYVAGVRSRAESKINAMSQPEAVNYGTQMALVRDAMKLSGIPKWTEQHTLGALFMGSAIRGAFRQLAAMGMLTRNALEFVEIAVDEQEIIAAQLEDRKP
jgi:hypothetical protein